MTLDPAVVDLIKWALTGLAWIGSIIITYFVAKRGKVDDLRIRRRHELVEKLAVLIQQDHQGREALMAQFQANFAHLERTEAYAAFEKHDSLYQGMRSTIERCAELKAELNVLAQEITIYVPEDLSAELARYLSATTFTYMTDGFGFLINTYGRSFFDNLLNESNVQVRRSAYANVMKGLRNVRH